MYDQRIREVEHGSFSPLVFSTAGGMGPTVVYKRIASMLAQKYDQAYSKTLHWVCCKLSYSLLRSAIMCLRGAHSTVHCPAVSPETMDLACQEGRIPLQYKRTSQSLFCYPLSPFYTSNTILSLYHFAYTASHENIYIYVFHLTKLDLYIPVHSFLNLGTKMNSELANLVRFI